MKITVIINMLVVISAVRSTNAGILGDIFKWNKPKRIESSGQNSYQLSYYHNWSLKAKTKTDESEGNGALFRTYEGRYRFYCRIEFRRKRNCTSYCLAISKQFESVGKCEQIKVTNSESATNDYSAIYSTHLEWVYPCVCSSMTSTLLSLTDTGIFTFQKLPATNSAAKVVEHYTKVCKPVS